MLLALFQIRPCILPSVSHLSSSVCFLLYFPWPSPQGDTATVLGEVERFLKGIYAKLGHLTRAENQMQQQQQSAQQQATSTQFDTTSGVSPLSRLGFAIVKRSTAEGLVKKAAMQRLPA
eukprot:TRINITY_DN8807_c0_g1_i5.p2 TRINITY_DN8807_c0_g1~~TRINITY_DN8807_c0_g1_i5.p2  ORF type:complete len:119 (-),score=17.58 TRINITY_DN8807_c0_g1_i5:508-864(-)